jgi:hypothetical protein
MLRTGHIRKHTIIRFILVGEEVVLQTLDCVMAVIECELAFWAFISVQFTPSINATGDRCRILVDRMTLSAVLLVIVTIILAFSLKGGVVIIIRLIV